MAHTLSELRELWALRDARYRHRNAVMEPAEEQAVRVYRTTEVRRLLPAETQAAGLESVRLWYPPSPLR